MWLAEGEWFGADLGRVTLPGASAPGPLKLRSYVCDCSDASVLCCPARCQYYPGSIKLMFNMCDRPDASVLGRPARCQRSRFGQVDVQHVRPSRRIRPLVQCASGCDRRGLLASRALRAVVRAVGRRDARMARGA